MANQNPGGLSELTLFLSETQVDVKFAYCPDIIAAYLEVVNTIWQFQLQNSLPMQPAAVTTSSASSLALFKTQKVINDILLASQARDPMASLRDVLLGDQLGVNTLVTALETIPKIWSTTDSHESKLLSLLTLYIDVVLGTTFVDAQTVAVENLAEVLDALLKGKHADKLPTSKLIDLWTCLPMQPMNPALSNAVIRASGGIVAALYVTGNVQPSGLSNWGLMIFEAGLEDKVRNPHILSPSPVIANRSSGFRYSLRSSRVSLLILHSCQIQVQVCRLPGNHSRAIRYPQ